MLGPGQTTNPSVAGDQGPDFSNVLRQIQARSPRQKVFEEIYAEVLLKGPPEGQGSPGANAAVLASDALLVGGEVLAESDAGYSLISFEGDSRNAFEIWTVEHGTKALHCNFAIQEADHVSLYNKGVEGAGMHRQLSFRSVPAREVDQRSHFGSISQNLEHLFRLLHDRRLEARGNLLQRLDAESVSMASGAAGTRPDGGLVAPLLYNFFNGSLPGVKDQAQARINARQALERWPGIGILTLAVSPVGANMPIWGLMPVRGGTSGRPSYVATILQEICDGADPAQAFGPPFKLAPSELRFMEGMPIPTVDGLLRDGRGTMLEAVRSGGAVPEGDAPLDPLQRRIQRGAIKFDLLEGTHVFEGQQVASVAVGGTQIAFRGSAIDVIRAVGGLPPRHLPADQNEGRVLAALAKFDLLTAAQLGEDGWKAWAPVLGERLGSLSEVDDYRRWAKGVARFLALDPEVATARLDQLGLRRWIEGSTRWHEQYPAWLNAREGECFPHRRPAAAASWDPIFAPGALQEALPAGWRATELLDNDALDQHGLDQTHCAGDYASFCSDGYSRIIDLRSPSEEVVTVEIRYRYGFLVTQCKGAENAAPSPAAAAAARGLVAALNKGLRDSEVAGTGLINPAGLAAMRHPRVTPNGNNMSEERLLALSAEIGTERLANELQPMLPFRMPLADFSVAHDRINPYTEEDVLFDLPPDELGLA